MDKGEQKEYGPRGILAKTVDGGPGRVVSDGPAALGTVHSSILRLGEVIICKSRRTFCDGRKTQLRVEKNQDFHG
jgi:hypothetical protein